MAVSVRIVGRLYVDIQAGALNGILERYRGMANGRYLSDVAKCATSEHLAADLCTVYTTKARIVQMMYFV